MLNTELKLNIVPFGKRGIDKKSEAFPSNWKQYKNKLCPDKVGKHQNCALICGKIPGINVQITVLDFDGQFGSTGQHDIATILEENLGKYYMNIWTGNRGFHFVYLSDYDVLIYNKQKQKLRPNFFPRVVKGVDVRGNGGLVYFPPTHFIDSKQEYKFLFVSKTPEIISSKTLSEFIKRIFVERPVFVPRSDTQEDVNQIVGMLVDDRLKKLRVPLRALIQPCALDLEDIANQTGMPEMMYWSALWKEVLYHDVSEELVMKLLDKYQPSFDMEKTIHQLQYLDMSVPPFKNETLETMFPGWKAPAKKQKREYKGFVE